jgi:hypothetical protein
MRRWLTVVALAALAIAAVTGPALLLLRAERGQAAFGDNETLGLNRLSSATVDIEPGAQGVPITVANMAPGDRLVGSIEIKNIGTLAIRYAVVGESSPSPLADWLRWEIWPVPIGGDCLLLPRSDELLRSDLVIDGVLPVLGDSRVGPDPGDRVLAPTSTDMLCTAVRLPLDAPDSLQAQRYDQEFTLVAEQRTDETP